MEDDRSRLAKPLKTRWNLILQNILDEGENTHLLNENHQAIHQSLDELNKNLHQLSQDRHHLNCRLEFIKNEIEQLLPLKADPAHRFEIEQKVQALKNEGYSIQIELESIEKRLRSIRQSQVETMA